MPAYETEYRQPPAHAASPAVSVSTRTSAPPRACPLNIAEAERRNAARSSAGATSVAERTEYGVTRNTIAKHTSAHTKGRREMGVLGFVSPVIPLEA